MSIIILPFKKEEIRTDGVFSLEEFREWVLASGEDFLHNMTNPNNGDILIFAWKESPSNWILVGDAIVKENHKTGKKNCSCEDAEKYYKRHILTGGVRLYPKSVHSDDAPIRVFTPSTPIDKDGYLEIISKSVSHWVNEKGV